MQFAGGKSRPQPAIPCVGTSIACPPYPARTRNQGFRSRAGGGHCYVCSSLRKWTCASVLASSTPGSSRLTFVGFFVIFVMVGIYYSFLRLPVPRCHFIIFGASRVLQQAGYGVAHDIHRCRRADSPRYIWGCRDEHCSSAHAKHASFAQANDPICLTANCIRSECRDAHPDG